MRSGLVRPGPVSGTLAIAVGLFVAAAVALAVNFSRQSESFGWVEHTNEVLRNISVLKKGVLETEAGERGYLLTGESRATSTATIGRRPTSLVPTIADE